MGSIGRWERASELGTVKVASYSEKAWATGTLIGWRLLKRLGYDWPARHHLVMLPVFATWTQETKLSQTDSLNVLEQNDGHNYGFSHFLTGIAVLFLGNI